MAVQNSQPVDTSERTVFDAANALADAIHAAVQKASDDGNTDLGLQLTALATRATQAGTDAANASSLLGFTDDTAALAEIAGRVQQIEKEYEALGFTPAVGPTTTARGASTLSEIESIVKWGVIGAVVVAVAFVIGKVK